MVENNCDEHGRVAIDPETGSCILCLQDDRVPDRYEHIARVHENYNEEKVETLLQYIEWALERHESEYAVSLDDDAVREVQDEICRSIDHMDNVTIDDIIDELKDPKSTAAQTNIGFAVGIRAPENEGLRQLMGAVLAENYSR